MENIEMTVRMLAAYKMMSIEELAKACGISPGHLKQVSAGNVKMTAYDLKQLAAFTGVPADSIISHTEKVG